jgi:hypothetical protein
MVEEFQMYFNLGLKHVLDWKAYDHVLFLIVLTVFYSFKDWKKILWLTAAFTLGHSLTLALSAFDILYIKMNIIEFLIPLTILITAIYNLITVQRPPKSIKITLFFAFVFGLIHGLGFSSYFKILVDDTSNKIIPLLEFAIGIEIAQVIMVMAILIMSFFGINILKRKKRDCVLVISSVVIGVVIPMLIERKIW